MLRHLFVLSLAITVPGWSAVRYQTTSDWGSGFCGTITVTNDTAAALNPWSLQFDFDRTLSSIWDATATRSGNRYTVSPASWNAALAVGASVSFGFCGASGNVVTGPTNYALNGTPSTPPPTTPPPTTPPPPPAGTIQVNLRAASSWSTGYTADLIIHNNGTQAVNGWTLSFTLGSTITSLWNGTLTVANGTNVVRNASWNGSIPIGGSVQLGFTGNGSLAQAANCTFNGTACGITIVTGGTTSPPPPTNTPGAITIDTVDTNGAVNQIPIRQVTNTYTLRLPNVSSPAFKVTANNPRVVTASVNGSTLTLTGIAAGRSGLRIEETATKSVRYVGVRVAKADGSAPGMPSYVAVGSVSEDTTDHLNFWKGFGTGDANRYVDVRYIYLNGGPVNGWNTWGNYNGSRLVEYIRNSRQLGFVPFFVWYNIPAASESYWVVRQNVADPAYMKAYFQNLKLALDLIQQESPNDTVGMIIEPDFLGYLAQNANAPASAIYASTRGVYEAGLLTQGADPAFADTVQGLVQAINYCIRKYTPQVDFGWQVNLWASPPGGFTTSIPGKGIIQKTLTSGITLGRQQIAQEAAAIANYYLAAGVGTHGAKFLSIDKYGLDAVGAEASAATNPANAIWFWNNDLWGNYLIFANALKQTSNLPVVLWQIPVGHINSTREPNPFDPLGLFPDLINTTNRYEDSAPTYFFGDTFVTTGSRFTWFASNQGNDPKLRVNANAITWGSHMQEAAASGVFAVLFGPGVGISTTSIGANPGDKLWWMTKVQRYLAAPTPRQ
ncbi:MAG: cellulose binding domain-containing protein [Bryobacterales bacterium]|nr:cellulose binding domain-containing protein [Bryobacterales bacterium]